MHGVHLLLWVLDVSSADVRLRVFSRLRAQFERGVVVEDGADLVWRQHQQRLVGTVSGTAGNVVRISLTPADGQALPWAGPGEIGRLECEEHELLALEEKSGQVLLALPRGWTELFPHLATGFPPAVIAALLATTRLVGMISPGLHSIYSGLDLSCDDAAVPAETLVYRVFRADPRVRLVEMAVQTGGLRGTVSAFLRPKPYAKQAWRHCAA